MRRVRLFCDWDDDSFTMLVKLQSMTDGMTDEFQYKNIKFVYDESYEYSMIFNFPVVDFNTPPERSIALILEPREVLDKFYSHHQDREFDNVKKIYSFAKDKWDSAYGIGFSTAPKRNYPPLMERSRKACMIASNKLITPFHLRRHEIRDALMNSGLDIDFYGRGLSSSHPRCKGEILPNKKYEILEQYSFCIDFENSPLNAVTDKFFDPVQCNTVPITNALILEELLPTGGYELLNFSVKTKLIVECIEAIIEQQDLSHYVEPLAIAKAAVRSGHMNLTEWIYQRINELDV